MPLEEKLQPVQCRDPEPSRFAHNLQNRKWSLSCFSGSASLGRPFRLIEDLRVIRVVTSGFGVLVALAHVIKILVSQAESKLKGESRSIRMEDFLSWGQCFT